MSSRRRAYGKDSHASASRDPIGNPLGFENTATAGIVSDSTGPSPAQTEPRLRLSTWSRPTPAISPGNSGGALVGGDGRVIGVNVAYIPPTQGAVALGFAIPAATVADVVEQLLDTGTVATRSWAFSRRP